MSNISFANPWLLLIALPLIAVVLVPFFITVKRDNANFHNIASVSLHIIICICITLALSGMAFETVLTETQVYVLADVSYSAQHNIEDVQESVEKVARKLPKNSQMSVICFGRNYQIISDMGEKVPDITTADKVDKSATDIGSALRYAGNLFDDNVIKRIIVITDGVETVSTNSIVKVVSALQDNGVYVDAVFIDDNISDETRELQIDSAQASSSTYLNKEEEVNVLVRANCGLDENGEALDRTDGYVTLYRDGVTVERKPVSFYNGLNVVTIPLATDTAGSFDYEIKIEAVDAEADSSPYNNTAYFTQKVSDERNVLFLGGSDADITAGRRIYGTDGVTYISEPTAVPLTVEDMCKYDEIVLCNFDVRTIRASTAFMTNLTTLVDDYGKTLTTYGNTFIQEDDDTENSPLKQLSDLLPVRIGNYDQYTRLVAIVLDISLSMNYNSRMNVAKSAAVELLNKLNTTDTVMVVGFSRIIDEFMPATQLTARQVVIEKITDKDAENGTSLSGALEYTYSKLPTRYQDRQVIVITDALCSSADQAAAYTQVRNMNNAGITVSALGIYPQPEGGIFLNSLIENGSDAQINAFCKDIKHESDIGEVFKDIAEDTQKVRIDEDGIQYEITLRRPDEQVAQGVGNIGSIDGFWYSAAKTQSTVVLTAKYYRDKITTFDVPVYAYWSGGGKGKVFSFLSDISSDWAGGWTSGTEGGKFLANIPSATLPDERITTPFVISADGKGNETTIYVQTSTSLTDGATFKATLTDPDNLVTVKTLAFDSNTYFTTFATDAPGLYKVHLEYVNSKGLTYEADMEFSVSYYAEYDSFTSYSKSYLYRLLSNNGKIIDLEEAGTLENSDSEFTTYKLSFTLPLMVLCAVLFVADIIIRQLKWKDVTSFFSGLFRRRR